MDPALATLGAFFLTSLAIELTPGPNMAYLALVGVSRGRTDGLMAVAGVCIGLAVLGAIVGVGLGSLILDNVVSAAAPAPSSPLPSPALRSGCW